MRMTSGPAEGGSRRTVSRSVLVVSSSEKSRDVLKELLSDSIYIPRAEVGSGGEARRLLLRSSFDAVVINAPLSDEFGHELAELAAREGAGVILAVRGNLVPQVNHQLTGSGVFVLGKPLSRELFSQVLFLLTAFLERVRGLEEKTEKLRKKLEDTRRICRAKCLLVEYMGVSEEEAHRQLENWAMDGRMTLKNAAEEIIGRYGGERQD